MDFMQIWPLLLSKINADERLQDIQQHIH